MEAGTMIAGYSKSKRLTGSSIHVLRVVSTCILVRMLRILNEKAEYDPDDQPRCGAFENVSCDQFLSWNVLEMSMDDIAEGWLQHVAEKLVIKIFAKGDRFRFVQVASPLGEVDAAMLQISSYVATDPTTNTSILVQLTTKGNGMDLRATACFRVAA